MWKKKQLLVKKLTIHIKTENCLKGNIHLDSRKFDSPKIKNLVLVKVKFNGMLLLIKKFEKNGFGTWGFPSGTHKSKESVLDTAKRIILEETGIIRKNLKCVNMIKIKENVGETSMWVFETTISNKEADDIKLSDENASFSFAYENDIKEIDSSTLDVHNAHISCPY